MRKSIESIPVNFQQKRPSTKKLLCGTQQLIVLY